jgi:histidinol-phosphate/aromatic aminotransferase/cobyric acid decarboxylase-like protein
MIMLGQISSDSTSLDFGTQGGDPSRGVDIDLNTCVNRYGPAPGAIAALRAIEPCYIVLHPNEAAPELIELYRDATGVTDGAMIAGRGAS